jgi:hypothetical protein
MKQLLDENARVSVGEALTRTVERFGTVPVRSDEIERRRRAVVARARSQC